MKKFKRVSKSTFNIQQMFSEAERHGTIVVDYMGYKFEIRSLNGLPEPKEDKS